MQVTSTSEDDELNYKTLRRIQQQEQTLPGCTKISPDFYQESAKYIQNLNQRIANEKNLTKNKIYQEELQNTKKIINNIYELREKKIVQSALSTVRGAKPDLKNLIEAEKKLYEQLLIYITQARTELLNTIKTEQQPKPGEKPIEKQENEERIFPSINTHPIIRMLADVPEFVGIDMQTYSLKKDDVLSMQSEMSALLTKRGAAAFITQ